MKMTKIDANGGELPTNAQTLTHCARALLRLVMVTSSDTDGRVRAEDALALLATMVGERVLDAAGEMDPRAHSHTPGQRLFSERVNQMLAGDRPLDDAARLPPDSVFGLLLQAAGDGYGPSSFPAPRALFHHFAEHVGEGDDWGSVPLSVPAEHRPGILPIKAGYETRAEVDALLAPLGENRRDKLSAATLALGLLLQQTRSALPAGIAMQLVAELVNGMAKTAPLTADAMARYQAARAKQAAGAGGSED